jgi:lactoylglutathione lyase
MAKLIHTMVRVLDEVRSVDFYEKAFGLKVADRYDFDDFTLVYLRNDEADVEVEFVLNKGRTEPYGRDDGYGHIAFAVHDLDDEHARFEKLGLSPEPIKELKNGTLVARFFFVNDPDGYRIELLQRQSRFR